MLVVPALFAVFLVLVLSEERPPRGRPPEPPRASRPDSVAGFSLGLETPDGRVELSLVPLHADPARQAYDARALASRLDLAEGEPWLLTARGPRGLDLSSVRVSDPSGDALIPLARCAGRLSPPWATALSGGLASPRGEARIVLWGRRPGAGARLSVEGSEGVLEPARLEVGAFDSALARLDPESVLEAAGKDAGGAASLAEEAGEAPKR